MIIPGYIAYQEYMAIRLHFTSGYDYFKYGGKSRVTEHSFLKRKDRFFFEKIERKHLKDLVNYFVSSFIKEGNTKWSGSISGPEGEKTYLQWLGHIESLSYKFKEDVSVIMVHAKTLKVLFMTDENSHPILLRLYLGNHISIETMLLIDAITPYIKYWTTKMDDVVWNKTKQKLEKYQPFFLDKIGPGYAKNLTFTELFS